MKLIKKNLKTELAIITLIPVLLTGIIMTIFAVITVKDSTESEIFSTLDGVCSQANNILALEADGSYEFHDGILYSNGRDISYVMNDLDKLKQNFNVEVSVFLGNTRVQTTICDSNCHRIIGSTQDNSNILSSVYSGKKYVSRNVDIHGTKYFGVYIPLYDNGHICGMIFSGLSSSNYASAVNKLYYKIVLFMLITVVVIGALVISISGKIAAMLSEIKNYLSDLATKQTSDISISSDILKRQDEIGDLSRYAICSGEQIREIMGTDPLTKLLNRRTGIQYMEKLRENALSHNEPFTVVIFDIDYFKRVNDTFGHEMGDEVLVKVSNEFRNICAEIGYAIRWGGEEFVAAFSLSPDTVYNLLLSFTDTLADIPFVCDNTLFHITITAGIAQFHDSILVEELVDEADHKLYIGKNEGRNRIVM